MKDKSHDPPMFAKTQKAPEPEMTTTREPEFYQASDYAGLRAGDFHFYYGYEFGKSDDGEIWGFRAQKNGKVVLEYAQSPQKYEWCPVRGLMEGIGKYLLSNPS